MSNDDGKFKVEISLEELRKRKLFVGLPLYGGICHGSFMRGMSDLSSLCRQHGIEMMMHILMNESLIPRARNYCCDEFMRSECTHMIFIDSDIGFKANDVIGLLAMMSDDSPYDVVGGAYPKKSHHKDNLVLTEHDGWKTIHHLVETKFTGKVASLGTSGRIEWKSVIAHSRAPHLGAPWVKIQAQNQKGDIVTADHKVAVIENPLMPYNVKWVEAQNLHPASYVVRMPNVRSGNNNENSFYNPEQISFLIGTLLGDGGIDSKGYLKFGHSTSQEDYINFKAELFGGAVTKERKVGSYKNKEYKAKFLYPPRNDQQTYLRDLMYPNGKKSIVNIMDYIDERALAMWYMDDGSLTKNGNGFNVMICSESFGDENHLLVDMFDQKFGIKSTLNKCNNGERIRIAVESYERFFGLIGPHVIESMKYKIPDKHHVSYVQPDFKKLDICAKKVTVEYVDTESDQYDITVEDNHNFVSNHYVVSNCISWEKIKAAVDKGFADENPDNLRKFVGDYVFNPTGDTKSFNINQPVEVLETGTGFMMIRKKTFQNFQTAFPSAWYRPDHVRTEHFDGTRMVMAYFDCIIDRGFGWDDALNLLTDVANKNGTADELAARSQKLTEITKNASMRYLSEDYKFCQDVRKAGMKVWLAPWVELEHTGSYVFGGSLRDLAALGSSPTADPGLLAKFKGKT